MMLRLVGTNQGLKSFKKKEVKNNVKEHVEQLN